MTFDLEKPKKKKPKLNSRFKKNKKSKENQNNEDEILLPKKKPLNDDVETKIE